MKKIKHYSGKSIDFYKEVRDAKRDSSLKASLSGIHDKVETLYATYDSAFVKRQLPKLVADTSLADNQRDELLSLYSYKMSPFKKLREKLTTNEYNQVDAACPYCAINTADTFDHILPKEEFKEYAVHPLNLIPCCSQCNRHKSAIWKKGNELKYLNLYQDELPEEQYLFVTLKVKNGVLVTKFEVRNNGKINAALFERIQDTYTKFCLCNRFRERCFNTICELRNTIQSNLSQGTSKQKIIEQIMCSVKDAKKRYGFNHWEAILKEACCQDAAAFDCLCTMK